MIQVEIVCEDNILPVYAKDGDSGVDVRIKGFSFIDDEGNLIKLENESSITLDSLDRVLIHTGVYMSLPNGVECQVRPRSGLALKQGLSVLNTPGTIDNNYRGECNIIIVNLSKNKRKINIGDKIAQFVFVSVLTAGFINKKNREHLSHSDRGMGGFGHTGV